MANPPGFFVDGTGRAHVPFSTGTASTPTTGDWVVGNVCSTNAGTLYVCTVAGTGVGATWTAVGGGSAASESAAGIVELATAAETATGTDNTRAVHPAGAAATYATITNAATKAATTDLVDAAGDLLVGTADNTLGKLAKGTALQVLRTNAGATALEWATAAGSSVATDAIFDAKGDLPVGTGADTAAKLTAGVNGARLTADSNSASGLIYARAPVSLLQSGQYTSAAVTAINTTYTLSRAYYHPFVLDRRTTFDRIAANHTATAVASSVGRLGIYANHATDDKPGALILDAGTIDLSTAAAFKTITINQALDPGVYWLCSVVQVANSPQLTGVSASTTGGIRIPDAGSTAMGGCLLEVGITGALPSNATAQLGTLTTGPIVYLRAA